MENEQGRRRGGHAGTGAVARGVARSELNREELVNARRSEGGAWQPGWQGCVRRRKERKKPRARHRDRADLLP
jgi:phage-related tail fiber protein